MISRENWVIMAASSFASRRWRTHSANLPLDHAPRRDGFFIAAYWNLTLIDDKGPCSVDCGT
jgi:hypothetical protein